MRFLTIFLALSVLLPAEAGAKNVARKSPAKPEPSAARAKANRKIANKLPSRMLTFVCRNAEGEPENVIGLTHMIVGLQDPHSGSFSSSIYLRTEKGYLPKTISGTYATVPNGFIFRTKWQSLLGEFTMIHIHPAEKTSFPGMVDKQTCEVTGQLESP